MVGEQLWAATAALTQNPGGLTTTNRLAVTIGRT